MKWNIFEHGKREAYGKTERRVKRRAKDGKEMQTCLPHSYLANELLRIADEVNKTLSPLSIRSGTKPEV